MNRTQAPEALSDRDGSGGHQRRYRVEVHGQHVQPETNAFEWYRAATAERIDEQRQIAGQVGLKSLASLCKQLVIIAAVPLRQRLNDLQQTRPLSRLILLSGEPFGMRGGIVD